MNFKLRNELSNFGTKFGIFWQKFCEIDCKTSATLVISFVICVLLINY